MKTSKLLLFLTIIFLLISCREPEPLSPYEFYQSEQSLNKSDNMISVMTRNLYVGTDVDMILEEENPELIPVRVAEAFNLLQETNFPERALALAKEIIEKQPDLIGLQEVSTFKIQSPGDAVIGGSIPAEDLLMDYLQILMTSLNYMGADYNIAAKIKNADVELPMLVNTDPLEFDDIRLIDYDVILAKNGVQISNVEAVNYETNIIIPEKGIEIPRGYTAVTASINNHKCRFVNTHLEDADKGGILLQIQLAQAEELISRLEKVTIPVILVGDFNSAAPFEATYRLITEKGFYIDTWNLNSSSENILGYTYGHDLDLRNESQNFWKRIDYIFVKNAKNRYSKIFPGIVVSEVIGDEPEDKTPSGLWPSDHGGVFAEMRLKSFNLQCAEINN